MAKAAVVVAKEAVVELPAPTLQLKPQQLQFTLVDHSGAAARVNASLGVRQSRRPRLPGKPRSKTICSGGKRKKPPVGRAVAKHPHRCAAVAGAAPADLYGQAEEAALFGGMGAAGIDFGKYDDIEVDVSGRAMEECGAIDSFADLASLVQPFLAANVQKCHYECPTPGLIPTAADC